MVAYRINFYNSISSTTVSLTSQKVVLDTPFWGVNYAGETQFYTVEVPTRNFASHDLVNGGEYKLTIEQWWSENDSVKQITASVFKGMATPTLEIDSIPDPLTTYFHSFTATYEQEQGDGIKWVRWQIADADNKDEPFLDTGVIYGTGQLQVDYAGFITGNSYAVRCMIETASGVDVSTGWYDFDVEYSVATAPGDATACQINNDCYVWLQWTQIQTADGYSIFRQTVGDTRLVKIADVGSTTGQINDYSARSGSSYIYYVFPTGALAYLTDPMVSNVVEVKYWMWAIIVAEKIANNEYSVTATHLFRYGAGGVSEGSFSNNNSPSVELNFTKYPTRQGSTANYLTGSVSGYIGTISRETVEYHDTIALGTALRNLSNSQNALFLADPKGHFLRIHTNAPITMSIDHKKYNMPMTVTIPWVEVGTTEGVHVMMYQRGDFYPTDRIIFTSLNVNPKTGTLMWNTPDNYTGTGSALSLNADGVLVQDASGPFNAATMSLDTETMIVSATLSDEGE